jgi:DNA-binding response OmpR family regulator
MADESGSNPNPARGQPSSSPSPRKSNEAGQPPLILLLAEDNFPDALLVREAIQRERLPLEVHIVPDGQQAIDFIARSEADADAPVPHILILDLNLPKMDGFEVLRRIRASHKHKNLPVIVVTSSDSPEDRKEAARLGARYFRKPTGYEEYLKIGVVLKQVLEEAKG